MSDSPSPPEKPLRNSIPRDKRPGIKVRKLQFAAKPTETRGEITAEAYLIRTAERTKRAIELRKCGATYREIGREIGTTTEMACKYVRDAVKSIQADVKAQAAEILLHDFSVTERMLDVLLPKIEDGDDASFPTVLKVLDRRAKYMGLDAPVRTDSNVNVNGNLGLEFMPRNQVKETVFERIRQLRGTALPAVESKIINQSPESRDSENSPETQEDD